MINSNSIPPFNVGQRVVCISNDYGDKRFKGVLVVGDTYTVKNVEFRFERWYVVIEEDSLHLLNGRPKKYAARHFAEVKPTYSNATSEILSSFPITEGGQVDKVLIPEKVNN